MNYKWRVQKCKRPSTRWVAWRVHQKKKTGKIFESWSGALIYALATIEVDKKIKHHLTIL